MAKCKFKAGDRVRCLHNYNGQFTAGKEYVVSKIHHFGIEVERDDKGSSSNGWSDSKFELVRPVEQKFNVGDRVQANGKFQGAAKKGDLATVSSKGVYWCEIVDATCVDVVWDRVPDGHVQADGGYYLEDFDLVEPAPPSPIRTVTRREIVPGHWGSVLIEDVHFDSVDLDMRDFPGDVTSLREAARIFNEIADVLDENAKKSHP